MIPPTRYALALVLLMAIGAAARLRYLDRPMQYDEAFTYNEYASKPALDGLARYTFPNNHLLNTWFVHASTAVFGSRPWAVRLPAFAAGLLLIPAVAAMVGGLCGRSPALLAAALVTSSEPLINYSTNARGYILVVLATTWLVILARRIRADGGRATDWLAFTLVSALGYFAIPIMLYPHGGIGLWLVLTRRLGGSGRRARVRLDRLILSTLLTAALTVLFYLPALMGTGVASVVANPFVQPQPIAHVLLGLPASLASAWRQWNLDVPWALALLAVLAWVVSLVRPSPGRSGVRELSGLLLILVGWTLTTALVQRVIPYDRVWLFLLPIYLGCVGSGLAIGFERLTSDRLAPVLAVSLGLGLCVLVLRADSLSRETRELSLDHAEALARFLKPQLRPDDGVVAILPCDATLTYAFGQQGIPVNHLHDYRIASARRLFLIVGRTAHQSLGQVLAASRIRPSANNPPKLVNDLGGSALYRIERQPP